MAIKNLIVPGFVGTGTIEYIVNRGYEAAVVLDVIATVRFDVNYDQYFIVQLDDGSVELNKGYQKYEITETLPTSTDVISSHSLLSSDQIVYQLGNGAIKFSKDIS